MIVIYPPNIQRDVQQLSSDEVPVGAIAGVELKWIFGSVGDVFLKWEVKSVVGTRVWGGVHMH